MTATLRVLHSDEVAPRTGGTATVRPTLGAHTGFAALELAVIVCAHRDVVTRSTGACEETLYVLAGNGSLTAAGETHALEPELGVYLAPGVDYELRGCEESPLRLVAVGIPDPEPAAAGGPPPRCVVRRLADQESQAATTDRQFRIVADPSCGLRSATHFVGYIPTVRAPEHFHAYDEVIYVLDGEGIMRSGGEESPLAPGACIQLPARTVHCLENTGSGPMQVVAVFRPAGSPAAAYYPDGTPAFDPDGEPEAS